MAIALDCAVPSSRATGSHQRHEAVGLGVAAAAGCNPQAVGLKSRVDMLPDLHRNNVSRVQWSAVRIVAVDSRDQFLAGNSGCAACRHNIEYQLLLTAEQPAHFIRNDGKAASAANLEMPLLRETLFRYGSLYLTGSLAPFGTF